MVSSAHAGKGKDRRGQWSLRINDQWHVCFEWRDDISVNQFIASAAAEKMASVLTLDYLKSEAAQGKRSDFEHYLGKVPDVWAQEGDEAD